MLGAGSNAKESDTGNQASRIKVYDQAKGWWIGGKGEMRNIEGRESTRMTLSLPISVDFSWILLRFYL